MWIILCATEVRRRFCCSFAGDAFVHSGMKTDLLNRFGPVVLSATAILSFVAFKWSFLGLPLFWDEAWVYGPAARAMYSNGLSLLPNTIGTELSRGHPLLFQFLSACWMHVFGTSNFALHAFALTVSVLLLAVVYILGCRLASNWVGLSSVVLVILSEPFLAQSGILLPEIMLSLCVLIAIGAYITKSIIGTILSISAALLIKESAVVLVLALLCWHFLAWAMRIEPRSLRDRRRWTMYLAAPLLIGLAFHTYQRFAYGWFFYPEHLGLMSWDVRDIHYTFKLAYRDLFEQQGMEWATLAFGLIVPLAWKKWSRRWLPVLVVLLYICAIKVLDGKWALPPLPTILVTLFCFAVIMFLQIIPLARQEPRVGEFLGIAMIFTWGFILFSSINFFSDRYLMSAVPLIAIAFSGMLYSALNEWHKVLFPIAITSIAVILFAGIGADDRVGDTRLSYRDSIAIESQLIAACDSLELHDDPILCSFAEQVYMTSTSAGYLPGVPFKAPTQVLSTETRHALITNFAQAMNEDAQELRNRLKRGGFEERVTFSVGKANGQLYSRVANDQVPDHP